MAGVIAAVLALLAVPAPNAVAVVPGGALVAFAYDGTRVSQSFDNTAMERGPPRAYDRHITNEAVDRWSHGALARPGVRPSRAYTDYDSHVRLAPADGSGAAAQGQVGGERRDLTPIPRVGVAAKTVDIGGAKFAQKSFSEAFSSGRTFAGRTIDDVAGDLRSGALTAKDVPIDVIVRGLNKWLIVQGPKASPTDVAAARAMRDELQTLLGRFRV